MKKAVFFDIDGTLWDAQMCIPKSTNTAVSALRANGHYAFICSGRSRANIRSPRLLNLGFDGVIAACGTHIEVHTDTVFEHIMTPEQVHHALAVLKKYHMPVILEGPTYIYADEQEFTEDPYVIHLRKELGKDLKSIEGTKDFCVNKMSAEINGADIESVMREFGSEFDWIIHNENLVEIIPAGYSKASGIQKVCELLGIEKKDTYAFGDSPNDLEMLSYVAHGIAMGNAVMQVKKSAEYVTADIGENGIQKGLQHYGLI